MPAAKALVPSATPSSTGAAAPELDPTLLAALEKLAADYAGPSVPQGQMERVGLSKTAQGAAVAWLYLYMLIAGGREDA